MSGFWRWFCGHVAPPEASKEVHDAAERDDIRFDRRRLDSSLETLTKSSDQVVKAAGEFKSVVTALVSDLNPTVKKKVKRNAKVPSRPRKT